MFRHAARLTTLAFIGAGMLFFPRQASGQAAHIAAITPPAARHGESVTITGNGFGAFNVRIAIGGVSAPVLAANGNQVTFVVPAASTSGPTVVIATNPGGQSGTIGFTVLEGILLPGSSNALAVDALFDLPPVRVEQTLIENGIITTRLDVRVAPTATVGQLNAALNKVSGGIVSMLHAVGAFTIAIPRQGTVDGLLAIAATLKAQPGIAFVKLAREAGLTVLPGRQGAPNANGFDSIAHLLPARFPAAWNAGDALVNGSSCSQPKVPILIPDVFGTMPPGFDQVIGSSLHFVSGSADPSLVDPDGLPNEHGYLVSEIVGANGTQTFTGANPFSSCLDLRAVQTAGLSEDQGTIDIAQHLPSEKFILSYSQGYNDDCIDLSPPPGREHCLPPRDPTIALPLDRALDTTLWKELTNSRWSGFLSAVSAGNSLDTDAPNIYRGTGDSRYANKMAIAQLPDTSFAFVEDPTLWSPTSPGQIAAGFEPLFNPGDAAAVSLVVQHDGLQAAREDSVVVVGGTTTIPGSSIVLNGAPPSAVAESAFSKTVPDVKAVAERVFDCGDLSCAGNSMAAPQVAGLASYLWLLSPALRGLPASVTRQAIVANTWPGIGLIDAYATVLSLDAGSLPIASASPIRLALLDVNHDSKFDQNDAAEFLHHFFFDEQGNPITAPANPDYGRYDLNGDGFTGGPRASRFDLDRAGSTQFGRTSYSSITQAVEGNLLDFNESALTDLDILCYYAFSDLYTGDRDVRRQLLSQLPGSQRCVFSVTPRTVTLNTGQAQLFKAIGAPGTGAVTWTATCGTIDTNSGAYTAPGASGTCTVRATSVTDPSAFSEGTVTVNPSTNHISLSRGCSTTASKFKPFITPVDGKECAPTLIPYTAPSVDISGSVDEVYSYQADYKENLSASEIQTNSISSGSLTVHGHVGVAAVPAQPPFTGSIQVNAASTSSLGFFAVDGVYQATVTGQLSITMPQNPRFVLNLNVGAIPVPSAHCAVPIPLSTIDLSSCQLRMTELDVLRQGGPEPGSHFVVPFTFTGIFGQGFDPTTGGFYHSGFAINPGVIAIGNAGAPRPDIGDVAVSLNFSFTRIQ